MPACRYAHCTSPEQSKRFGPVAPKTYRSPRRVIAAETARCATLEPPGLCGSATVWTTGARFAAAAAAARVAAARDAAARDAAARDAAAWAEAAWALLNAAS